MTRHLSAALAAATILASGCVEPRDAGGPAPGRMWSASEHQREMQESAARAGGPSLYERLGGESAIRAVVDDLTERAGRDPRINFARMGMPTEWEATPPTTEHFRQQMTAFLVARAGGPGDYRGRDMRSAHRGMRIAQSEFNALLEDAERSMQAQGIAEPERRDFLRIFESYRAEIVEAR